LHGDLLLWQVIIEFSHADFLKNGMWMLITHVLFTVYSHGFLRYAHSVAMNMMKCSTVLGFSCG
jgi:hypothetical protein